MKGRLAFYEASFAALCDKATAVSRTTVPPSVQITGVTQSTLDLYMLFPCLLLALTRKQDTENTKGF